MELLFEGVFEDLLTICYGLLAPSEAESRAFARENRASFTGVGASAKRNASTCCNQSKQDYWNVNCN